MIIDGSYFLNRPYRIPDQDSNNDFISWLNTIEKSICNKILGRSLTNELLEALGGSSLEDRFTNLLSGVDEFPGLQEILVPSIYSSWLEPNQYKLTMVGMVSNEQPANSTLGNGANNLEFIAEAWNEYVRMVGHCGTKDDSTLWFYMNANKADFPTWKFHPPKLKNRFFN